MQEGGFIERWRQYWWNASVSCSSSQQTASSTDMHSLIGCMVVLGGFCTASLLVFFVEKLIGNKNIRQTKYADEMNEEETKTNRTVLDSPISDAE